MARDTKEKLMLAALKLFSERGYEGTNIRQITEELGLSKSAFYKHFASKEALRTAIMNKCVAYMDENLGSSKNLPPIPQSADELIYMTNRLVLFTMQDERLIEVRKLITLEQYRDEESGDLATKAFLTFYELLYAKLFEEMIKLGVMEGDDAEMLAFAFVTPLGALVRMADREPDNKAEILRKADGFIRQYTKLMCRK